MNTEQWQMLLDAFDNAASHTYQAAAQQAVLNVVGAVSVILLTLAVGVLLIAAYKYTKPKIDKSDRYAPTSMEMFMGVSIGIASIYLLLGALIIIPATYTIITYILNPDWAILQTLSTLIQ